MATQFTLPDLTFFAGDDWPFIPFQSLLPDLVTPAPTTGWTEIFVTFYVDGAFTTQVFQLKMSTGGVVVTDPTNGLFYAKVLAADSAKFLTVGITAPNNSAGNTSHRFFLQVERIDASGLRRTIGTGAIPVRMQ